MVSFDYDGGGVGKGGKVTMSVDDKPVAEGRIEHTVPFRVSMDETLDIGEDTGTPVSKDYKPPFRFTGNLNRVLVRLGESKLSAEDEEQIAGRRRRSGSRKTPGRNRRRQGGRGVDWQSAVGKPALPIAGLDRKSL